MEPIQCGPSRLLRPEDAKNLAGSIWAGPVAVAIVRAASAPKGPDASDMTMTYVDTADILSPVPQKVCLRRQVTG